MRSLLLILMVLLIFNSCGQEGELPMPVLSKNTVKGIPWLDYGIERFRAIEMVCYIDTSLYNPLNALDYTLEKSGVQFFDYVILGGSYLKKDNKGYYLNFSDDLLNVLSGKNRFIVPLQKKGIKVLLGVESRENASFGNVNEDEMGKIANDIYTALNMFGLDGVEFYDNADSSAYPPHIGLYDPDKIPEDINPPEWDYNRWLLRGWENGGTSLNDFFYTIRYRYDMFTRVNVPILVREKNYGSFLSDSVNCTSGFADFAGSSAQITYTFNIERSEFRKKSNQRYKYGYMLEGGQSGESWVTDSQYGPFFLEMDGGPGKNIFYPQKHDINDPGEPWGEDLAYFTELFKQGSYQAIYIHNLKAISETRTDPFYKNIYYSGDTNDPERYDFDSEDEFWQKSKTIPPVFIFSQIIRSLLDDTVICSGGDHLKDW